MVIDRSADWGYYAPPQKAIFLRLLIAAGLGRGVIRKTILQQWRKKYGNVVDVTRTGVNYRLNISDNVTDGKILASSVIYDRKELSYLKEACHGGVFVDVGANVGYYSLELAKSCDCKVVAIEPNPTTLQRLYFNVEINRPLREKISIVPFGVGPEGEFDLYSANNLGAASLHKGIFSSSPKTVKIKTKPLFDILEDQRIEKIDALKIDIEGMEDQALGPYINETADERLPKCIIIEDDQKHLWKTNLMRLLFDRGYVEKARTRGNAVLKLSTNQTL